MLSFSGAIDADMNTESLNILLWVHVDGAYAGVALACPEYRKKCYLAGINHFVDSFCVDFHKAHRSMSSLWDSSESR